VHLNDILTMARSMTVHLVNPSHLPCAVGVITPRWLFVLAGTTPTSYGLPRITDETLEPFDSSSVQAGAQIVGVTDRQALSAPVCRAPATWAHENHRGCLTESVSMGA
jgi:hypothetical protein